MPPLPDPFAEAPPEAFGRFDALFDHAPFGVALLDRAFRYVHVNAVFAEMNGLSVEAHLGKTPREIVPPFADEIERHLRRVFETGEAGEVMEPVVEMQDRPDERRVIRIGFFPVTLDGVVTHVGATIVDVTAQRRAEAEVAERERRLQTALRAGRMGTWTLDLATRAIAASDTFKETFGLLPAAPFTYEDLVASIHPDDRARWAAVVDTAILEGSEFEVECRLCWSDASEHWVLVRGSAVVDAAGAAVALSAVSTDITRQKGAEEALRLTRLETDRLALIAARTTNGIVLTDADGRTEWLNEGFTRLSGYTLDDLRGKRPAAVLQTSDTDRATAERIGAHVTAREPFTAELLNVRRDGAPFWVRIDAAPLVDDAGVFTGYLTIQTDVTEQKESEEALRESEERARLAIEAAQQGLWTWDPRTDVSVRDDRTSEILGLDADEALPFAEALAHTVSDADREHVGAAVARAADPAGDGRLAVEYRVPWPDGRVRWVRATARMSFDEEGGARVAVRMVGTLQDVTERREAEEALRRSEERFRLALEGGGMGTFEWDLVTDAVRIDEREAVLVGRPAESIPTGAAFLALIHADDVRAVRDAIAAAVEGRGDYAAEFRLIRPDGQVRWLAGRGHVEVEDGRPVRMLGLNFDVTERRRAEEELRRRTREMERFTYTVSHDLKSPLVTITGLLGMLEGHLEGGRPERARAAVERIRRAADRMGALIDDLLELSRVGRVSGDVKVVDVVALVEGVADGLRRRMAASRCRLHVRPDLPRVRADARRLGEAFENLLTNALKYACPGGATTVEVRAEVTEDEVRYVVEDDGPGIDPAYHKKVFELFQRLGGPEVEGTGMGLAIVSKIMELHDGRAWVESAVGEGARFYLAFPRHALVTDEPGDGAAPAIP